jgi:hypothetical protein
MLCPFPPGPPRYLLVALDGPRMLMLRASDWSRARAFYGLHIGQFHNHGAHGAPRRGLGGLALLLGAPARRHPCRPPRPGPLHNSMRCAPRASRAPQPSRGIATPPTSTLAPRALRCMSTTWAPARSRRAWRATTARTCGTWTSTTGGTCWRRARLTARRACFARRPPPPQQQQAAGSLGRRVRE